MMNEGTIELIQKNGKWKAQITNASGLSTVETPYHSTKERALNAGVKILRERMLEEGE